MNSNTLEVHTLDLSLGGAKFDCCLETRPGKVIDVQLVIPGHDAPLLIRNARVQWVSGLTFGVEFQQVGSGQLDELEQLIDEYDVAEESGHA